MEEESIIPNNTILNEPKSTRYKQLLIIIGMALLLIFVWWMPIPQNTCEWHYENITHIPCQYDNGTITGILQPLLNYSLSPEQNCEQYNVTFPGFNIKNETRNKELYNKVIPKC